MIKIKNGGALSTIQDKGRFNVMRYGFTQCGVMDSFSSRTANALVGNDSFAPVIEMTMLGITAEFTEDYVIAVSGGAFDIRLNNKSIKTNKAYSVKSGDILSVGVCRNGMRCYLAVGGIIKAENVMGSVSTDMKSAIGGYKGRKLKSGDELEILSKHIPDNIEKRELEPFTFDKKTDVRVVLGPQDDMFTDDDFKRFFNQQYTVTKDIDRMGIRLYGIPLKAKDGMDIISDSICFGSIQVPKSGQPIILMADHQTTGGYAKIATVISADLPKLAQVRQGDKICFKQVSVKDAEKLEKKQNKYFDKLKLG